MLTVPRLDELSYEQIFTRAKNMIPMMTDEWTDFNYHDPGITMLSTFAWLSDMQNYYLDATGEDHWLKYLKLLGITPKGDRAAECLVAFNCDNDLYIPQGTKLNRNDTVYEIYDSYKKPANSVVKIINETDNEGMDITHFAGKDKSYAEIFSYEGESSLYLGFKNKIRDEIEFFVDVKDIGRNAFDKDFSLSKISYQYYDGKEFVPCTLINDGTCGFLRSGFISLRLPETTPMKYFEGDKALNYIKCTLSENEYDILPQIGEITVNCTKAYQTDTLCTTLDFVYENKPITIDHYIGENDLISVYVEEDGKFRVYYRFSPDDDDKCIITDGENKWQKQITFSTRQPATNAHIKVTIANTDLLPFINIGETTGCAMQKIPLDIDDEYNIGLALVYDDNGQTVYDFYHRCENILMAKSDEKAFQFDKKNNCVIFGDCVHGIQPDAFCQVFITSLTTSFLENGNLMTGELNSFLTSDFSDISVKNIFSLVTGQKCENSEDLKTQVVNKFSDTDRAVSKDDYINIVKRTQGLIIDLVNIISPSEYRKFYDEEPGRNVVYVAVKPCASTARPVLSDNYIKLITDNLESHRLITSELRVIPAKYVGIEVAGLIRIKENSVGYKEKINNALHQFVDFDKVSKPFCNDIVYGELFAVLESLDCVSKVEKLEIERLGKGADKNDKGDILVYPDYLTYLYSTDIEFC